MKSGVGLRLSACGRFGARKREDGDNALLCVWESGRGGCSEESGAKGGWGIRKKRGGECEDGERGAGGDADEEKSWDLGGEDGWDDVDEEDIWGGECTLLS